MDRIERIKWIDCAKGIAIILVVFGHTLTTNIRTHEPIALFLYWCIYFFHTRLLFVLSGYTFSITLVKRSKLTSSIFLTNKIKRLLIPYIIYSSFVYTFFIIAGKLLKFVNLNLDKYYLVPTIKDFINGLISGNNTLSVHLWYIYTLFFITIIFYYIEKFMKNYTLILILGIVIFIFNFYCNVPITYIIKLIFDYFIYFALGCYLGQKPGQLFYASGNKNKFLWGYYLISWTFLFANAYIRVKQTDLTGLINNAILILIFSIGVILSVIEISTRLEGAFGKIFEQLGRKSYPIYILHQPFIVTISVTILNGYLYCPFIISSICSFLLGIMIPLLVYKVKLVQKIM